MFSKDIHVAFEWKPDVDSLLVGEQLCKDLIQYLTVCQRYQVNQERVLLIT